MADEAAQIVYPLHAGGGKFGADRELRMSLRSLERHFKGAFEVSVVGERLPRWARDVRHLKQRSGGLKTALKMASEAFPDGFFWVYDDWALLADTTAESMRVTPASADFAKPGSGWSRDLEKIRARLRDEGIYARDFSRPHGPYWFDAEMVAEGFADWPEMAGKFPWETWILSKRRWPHREGVTAQFYSVFQAPDESALYLSYNGKGNTRELRRWMAAKFPERSRFESPAKPRRKDADAARSLRDAWLEFVGDEPIRTAFEASVGPWSLLEHLMERSERTVLVEPDPEMAAEAATNWPQAEVWEVALAEGFGIANLRRLNGSSYVQGIEWAPAFDAFPEKKIRSRSTVEVPTAPFSLIDPGDIDVLNLDCEGSEWQVLSQMRSRPKLIQVEAYRRNAHFHEMRQWFEREGYETKRQLRASTEILVRKAESP